MPNSRTVSSRDYREKHRKKTRYSSDSDSEREKARREKSRSKAKDDKKSRESSSRHKGRRRRYSSSSSSSDSSSSSSSRRARSSSSSNRDKKSSKSTKPASRSSETSSAKKNFDHITKFEINELYKDEDKSTVLNTIESDTFKQENFQSKKKILIDLKKDKMTVPETLAADNEEESLIHPNFLGDEDHKVDKWIKKLHLYRSQ